MGGGLGAGHYYVMGTGSVAWTTPAQLLSLGYRPSWHPTFHLSLRPQPCP